MSDPEIHRAPSQDPLQDHPDAVLDMDALNELQDLLEEDFVALLAEFIDSSRQSSAMLSGMVDQNNLAELRRGAHSLKGSALNIGAPKLAQTWAALEDAAVAGLPQDQLATLLQQARGELEQTVTVLNLEFF